MGLWTPKGSNEETKNSESRSIVKNAYDFSLNCGKIFNYNSQIFHTKPIIIKLTFMHKP
jgi:hypothetical protein